MSAGPPWYRQGWPWLLILLPASTVIASMVTIWLAFTNDDALVHDDYYREGLAINRRLDSEARARELGMAAELRYDAPARVVELRLRGLPDAPGELTLAIEHPTDATRDQSVVLLGAGNGVFRGTVHQALDGKRYLLIEHVPADGQGWRLRGTLEAATGDLGIAQLDAG